ncbi:MAG: carbonate dehydratase [Haliea sp.]|nr:carbonate dehydratase [Haliea sp.]|tara:strand:+ start:115016 stop:117724 length:2709 start_codon:yes stop_codon:yes gene_type:complete
MSCGVSGAHSKPVREVLGALDADEQGLQSAEAAARLAEHGPNRLPVVAGPGNLRRFLAQFHNVLIYVLLLAALITALLAHWVDTAVILAVVVINAVIGFVQEGKAEKAMRAIQGMLAPRAAVLRGGERQTVEAADLVPGDVVLLEAGDRVPADLRLLKVYGLAAQEAILTGESLAVEKSVDPVSAEAALGDRDSLVFSGTLITTGQGRGVVVATGADTEIGRISGLLSSVETLTTPLLEQMAVFARGLTGVILALAGGLLAFSYFNADLPFGEAFMAVVGLSVAAIPEGLPAVMTITLAVGVQAMARRNAIVRRLPAIETVGSVSVICTDKTGTLTRNEMVAVSLATAAESFQVSGEGYSPVGDFRCGESSVEPETEPAIQEAARIALLCNDAALRQSAGEWQVEGDPMEGALLAMAAKAGLEPGQATRAWTRTDAMPFDASARYMATLHHDHQGQAFIFVKGAPERVLELCSLQRAPGEGDQPLQREAWESQVLSMANDGQRVLALACKAVAPEHTVLAREDLEQGLVLVGLVGLVDPPRHEAIGAVAECRAAGVRVKMITGDHAGTAAAIARQIGLEHADAVLTGSELDAMDDSALRAAVLGTDVFARTSPEHKLRLVSALQDHGLTVAMTGDGVNDAPALKRADAGIAMGQRGSEAAREAAELVLADDNFASIVAAVREGRTVYDNIRKVLAWTLPTNGGEAATIMIALLAGMSLPITPVQILWVNLITAVTLGLALAFEPTEANTMQRPPRPRREPLLSRDLLWLVVMISVLFVIGVFGVYRYAIEQGYSVELARTMAMNTLVVMEIFNLFYIRNLYGTSFTWQAIRGTRAVWATIAIVTLAQFGMTYLPFMQRWFGTAAVPLLDGLMIVGVGVLLLVVIEVEKALRLAWRRRQGSVL